LTDQPDSEEFEEFLKKLFESGQIDPEQLSKMAGIGTNPIDLAKAFGQMQSMMSNSEDPVNWEMATNKALEAAQKSDGYSNPGLVGELSGAFDMASLWLSEVTDLAGSEPPKHLTRSLWVKDAMPIFKELSEPVAKSMANALSENLDAMLPEEFSQMLGPAAKLLGNAGAMIFAMQLGQAIGKLSSQTLTSSELGIPISSRPGLIPQNVAEFMNDLETPKSEVLIYLAIRELAISGLYQSNRWLKDQITTQVREFAAGLKIDISSMEDLAQRIDPSDPQALNELIESGSFITPRSEEQDAALQRIEALLALIEGWADAVSFEAAKRLPAINAISELFMRRRATQGVSEKTFGILLGLKLRPRLVREATAMWQLVAQEFDGQKRDSLWQHPDQLPTLQDIQDPAQLISRLKGASDDIDSELRKLLGE
jgi:putative hydrolase